MIQEIKESKKILFPALVEHVDLQLHAKNTMQRRTYDVINILKGLGVAREHIDFERNKWITYDASVLEGSQEAEFQKKEEKVLKLEIDVDMTKERIKQKLIKLNSEIQSTIELRRLLKRNKKLNSKPIDGQPSFKLKAPFMVLKMAPETTHSKEVVERYENRVIVNCSKQTRIWDTARIISHLQLQSVPDESFLQSEIMIALGESLHRRVLSFK